MLSSYITEECDHGRLVWSFEHKHLVTAQYDYVARLVKPSNNESHEGLLRLVKYICPTSLTKFEPTMAEIISWNKATF